MIPKKGKYYIIDIIPQDCVKILNTVNESGSTIKIRCKCGVLNKSCMYRDRMCFSPEFKDERCSEAGIFCWKYLKSEDFTEQPKLKGLVDVGE